MADKYPICPVCGSETDTIYKDIFGQIIGCDECVSICNAWDMMTELKEFNKPDRRGEDGY